MKQSLLKFLCLCTALTSSVMGAAAHELPPSKDGHPTSRGYVSLEESSAGATIRIFADADELARAMSELSHIRRVLQHLLLSGTTSPTTERPAAPAPSVTATEERSLEAASSRAELASVINFHGKGINASNTRVFLEEIARLVTEYQAARRTDSITIDLSDNFIDGGFLEKLLEIIDPIKDRITELKLSQNKLYLRSIEQLAPLLLLENFKYLTVYGNFIATKRLLSFGAGIYDEEADDGYDEAYLTPDDLLRLSEVQRQACLRKIIWIPESYFKVDANPTGIPTDSPISREEILRIHRTYFGLPPISY